MGPGDGGGEIAGTGSRRLVSMSMHGGGGQRGSGRGGRVSRSDVAAQREENKAAPPIPDLFKRIVALFAPHKVALSFTVALVLISAAITVIPVPS